MSEPLPPQTQPAAVQTMHPMATKTAQVVVRTPEGVDFVDSVFDYLLAEFPQIAGPKFAGVKSALRAELAGERVYVAARPADARQAMAREVLALFNGRNASEVARRLNIGRATVYRVLKQSRGS